MPLGGTPRKLLDHAAGVRWSPDSQRVAFVRPDDSGAGNSSILTARSDGQDEQVLIPATAGVRWVQPAWSHDGAHVYVVRLPRGGYPAAIWRVASHGGSPGPVVSPDGGAWDPEPTPDGSALLYRGGPRGEPPNIWWWPLRGGVPHRLTTGMGAYFAPAFRRMAAGSFSREVSKTPLWPSPGPTLPTSRTRARL